MALVKNINKGKSIMSKIFEQKIDVNEKDNDGN